MKRRGKLRSFAMHPEIPRSSFLASQWLMARGVYRCTRAARLFEYPAWMLARCLPKPCFGYVRGELTREARCSSEVDD